MSYDYPKECKICGHSLYGYNHKRQHKRCSRLLQQRMAKQRAQESQVSQKPAVLVPYIAKRFSNGRFSTTEFY